MFRYFIIRFSLMFSLVLSSSTYGSSGLLRNAKALADKNLFFTSIPYIKEYLAEGNVNPNSQSELLIDTIITNSGVRQFEVLPESILERSDAPVVRYILAKKYFRKARYAEALNKLRSRIPLLHPVKPFALFLEGSIMTIQGQLEASVDVYSECIRISKMHLKRTDVPSRIRQLNINKDNCIVGIPRAQFGSKNHKKASLTYLDLEKESFVWPEILFEEAWNSFYLEDYNRSLGKLVTYKAPVFDYIFNPEVDILKAMSYLHLCLYDDVSKVVSEYYQQYQNVSKQLENMLGRMGRNYESYFNLGRNFYNSRKGAEEAIDKMLSSITRDPAFVEQMEAYNRGVMEVNQIRNVSDGRRSSQLRHNLRLALDLQKDLIGAYVRGNLRSFYAQIKKGFEDMTYMKLEILSRKKKLIYENIQEQDRKRGDIKYLKRNDKQYFWTFNGEFWADELGDYVFALRSECNE